VLFELTNWSKIKEIATVFLYRGVAALVGFSWFFTTILMSYIWFGEKTSIFNVFRQKLPNNLEHQSIMLKQVPGYLLSEIHDNSN